MSFFGTLFGGKRKHEEKMEKIKRDEQHDHDKSLVELELAKQGINPFDHSANIKAAGGIFASAVPLIGGALGMPTMGGGQQAGGSLGNMFGGMFGGNTGSSGMQKPNNNMMYIIIGAAVILFITMFNRKS